jgi:signal transduction histidine kinase
MGLGGLVVLLCLVGVGVLLVRGQQSEGPAFLALALAICGYGAVGALIASQAPRNLVGWLIAAGALAVAQFLFAVGLLFSPEPDSIVGWPRLLAWASALVPLPVAPMCLIFALLYFPDGRLANRWFRSVVWAVAGGSLLLFLHYLAHPEELGFRAGLRLGWAVGLPGVDSYAGIWGISMVLGSIAILVSLLVRRRRGSEEDRRPLRWLLRMLISVVALVAIGLGGGALIDAATGNGDDAWLVAAFFSLGVAIIVLFGIPMALTVGVLKYRVYEIDLAIRKTIVGKIIVVYVVLSFLAVVAAPLSISGILFSDLTGRLPAWVLIPVFLLGLSFGPVRRWARRGADRILYGERATPYEVLSEFSERVGETYSSEDVLPRMAQLLAAGTGASEARVWLRVGGELRDVARWPAETAQAPPSAMAGTGTPRLPDGDVFPVVHQGDTLGALAITVPASDPMNASKERLAHDLAAQAGLVLRNVRLVEELQDSRRRIVTAQDERARTLERNIHDGAQQQLVALTVKLGLVERLVESDPAKAAAMVAEAKAATGAALEDLRDLARGIYPPLLADEGLAAALRAQARKSALPVTVESDGIGRFPQDVEAAVYFCCLEAFQNVAKYADASSVTVRLERSNESLTFEIADDGVGFHPDAIPGGTGLQGMADRVAALGGKLDVRSVPGAGTTVAGWVSIGEGGR